VRGGPAYRFFSSPFLGRPGPRFAGGSSSLLAGSSSRLRLLADLVAGASFEVSLRLSFGVSFAFFLAAPLFGVLPAFFSWTSTSDAFFATSLPGREISNAGSLGEACLRITLPRFEVTCASPSVFLSETTPLEAPPAQFHATGEVSAIHESRGRCGIGFRSGMVGESHIATQQRRKDAGSLRNLKYNAPRGSLPLSPFSGLSLAIASVSALKELDNDLRIELTRSMRLMCKFTRVKLFKPLWRMNMLDIKCGGHQRRVSPVRKS
jgi:hypothetical protein